ncbi:hypothetical protein BFJ66_g13744 [Fusarium oxysporum f. sp. cepae]|uniref:Uncharacterized protein n=1 Tax=Fusarium oxysporum Fo47 TaxID=660027 RepID=W9JBP9_FUSOX|nr:hypothetical protein FOZG_16855 [Fusarium oxysporum Fo47]RKK35935.1 hypothetical protein BFJ66_g13744 [Fusarium oxysporum f. sp. cepae]
MKRQVRLVDLEDYAFASSLSHLSLLRGRRVYPNYQPGSTFIDLATAHDEETESCVLSIGGARVELYILLQNASTFPSLDNVAYYTLEEWMLYGQNKYAELSLDN